MLSFLFYIKIYFVVMPVSHCDIMSYFVFWHGFGSYDLCQKKQIITN